MQQRSLVPDRDIIRFQYRRILFGSQYAGFLYFVPHAVNINMKTKKIFFVNPFMIPNYKVLFM